jgi:chaperone BCS1
LQQHATNLSSAGCFGLDVFVISLLDPSLTEEDLILLFNSLPRQCVVLLEDIDASGITRKREEAPSGDDKTAAKKDWDLVDVAKALKTAKDEDDKDKKKGISLSGLLNAIDGVASHEGRVLVMTQVSLLVFSTLSANLWTEQITQRSSTMP